ncbi:stress response protein AzuC, partial [Escherichia coli]|nr:stress response protein AzuC [Escherichia coli]
LAGSEMKRLYAVGSENGGDGDAFNNYCKTFKDVPPGCLLG